MIKLKSNKGITIVALIITIIILIILALVAIKEMQGEGIIYKAKESKFKQEVAELKEQLKLSLLNQYANNEGKTVQTITTDNAEEIKQYIPNITVKNLQRFKIDNNELAYKGTDEDEIKWCRELNIYICSEFSPERWDKTATSETIFNWKSNDKSNNDYGVLTGIKDEYKQEYTDIIIPSRCTSITTNAFKNDKNIIKVKIPRSVTDIGSFYNCSNLEEIEIPSSVNTINQLTFYYCLGLKSITIPEGVTTLGTEVFHYCQNLESITLPSSLVNINGRAFSNCYKLTEIIIPENVVYIGNSAFISCSGLTKVNIPKSVVDIGISPFDRCTNLSLIQVDSNNNNFINESGVLFDKNRTRLICYTAKKQNEEYSVPNTVTNIDSCAFMNNVYLKKAILNDKITDIKSNTFYGCQGLQNIEIKNSVRTIESLAFFCCNLNSINIPEGVTNLGSQAFHFCSKLENITLPTTITNIDGSVFSYTKATNIAYMGTINQWNDIEKKSNWFLSSKIKTITCIDGTITL